MDAATIEEMNRIRQAMGLKLIPVPGAAASKPDETAQGEPEEAASTIETREALAYDNYKKIQDAEKAKREREARAEAIKKAREKAQRLAVLEGKGLGDADEEGDLDAKSWLKSQKKRLKKIEKERQKEEEAAAAAAAAAKEHTSKDLAGLKVGHDMSSLLDGDDQVLTLKDTTVLDEEGGGDELENIHLREQEKLQERLQLKKKRPVYDPNDIDETGERGILSQYDEEIHGKKKKAAFTLDSAGTISELADILEGPATEKKIQSLDMDILKDTLASDYLDPSEIKVKKPKKKKSKSTRRRAADDEDSLFPVDQAPGDLPDTSMDIDSGVGTFRKKRKTVDASFVDDDDLQASLALQRRDALKKRKRTRPEDIARQLKEEAPNEQETHEEGGGLVIDEISEFVSTLRKPGEDEDERPRKKSRSVEPVTAMDAESEDEEMHDGVEFEREESLQRERSVSVSAEPLTGVEEEKTIDQGMGATLQLLKERGLLQESHGAETHEQLRQKQKFLTERNRLLAEVEAEAKAQRERDRRSGLLDRMSAREREEYARKQNAEREYKVSQIMSGIVKEGYKPTINLKYVDEFGRELDQKEAFKFMSHAFHGRGSGKGKMDKKLKKIAEEKRREAQSFLDASQNVNMTSATAQQSKKRREAGVRLA
ncbi:U4/U6.U5 tri-snRNP-associated protein snu66 [Pleurostoma richardsiae]|uniref:U4/U6.U5 tri-snRNP-associated protein snu66 n=1 Tax=Pleurostoma richardsiae TaxID=41990 RepID=A0AA38VKM9_9PEZI|nr:U4/U6.U5 tri-snRNP-associated protein snu66 [Pleurostoma richardsiae]